MTASNQIIALKCKGDSVLSNKNYAIKFNDVIGCDHLSHNIISISKLTAKGHVVLFDSSGGYVIKDHFPQLPAGTL